MNQGDAKTRTPFSAWAGAAIFALVVAGAAAAAVVALHARANEQTAAALDPLPVRVAPLRLLEGYETVERFIGRVEPTRSTHVAFERAGLLTSVLVEEGERVTENQVLATLDTDALEIEERRLEAARAALEADLALAEATLTRAETLRGRGFETGQALDDARFRAQRLGASIDEIEAALARVALDRDKSQLRAPFNGVVARRVVDEGAVLQEGAAVALLQETTRPQARIGLPPKRAGALSLGDQHRIEIPGGEVEAVLVSISPDIDPATRTVAALFDLPADAPVAMGDVARLPLVSQIDARGAWAPLSALQEGERGLWTLYTVETGAGGPVARRAAVETLYVSDGRAYVRGPIPDGTPVILEGLNRLAQGQRIAPWE